MTFQIVHRRRCFLPQIAARLGNKAEGYAFAPRICQMAICLIASLLFTVPWAYCDAPTTERVDAVLVVDTSGSMLKTDPLRLRDEGAELFAQSLKSGDRLAILEFSGTAVVALPFSEAKPELLGQVQKLMTSISNEGEYTDLLVAIREANELLETQGRSDARKFIVLLSDGKMDPKEGSAPALVDELVSEVLPQIAEKGTIVHTLAFSDEADKALLEKIASTANGLSWFTPTADKIHESFSELFLAVKKPQVVALTKRGFLIDGMVQEATFYINREGDEQPKLKSPTGTILDVNTKAPGLSWFQGQKFDAVTVEKPEVGNWELLGVAKDGFATVLTNLKLVATWPSQITEGEPAELEARFFESEKAVVLPEMTQFMDFAYRIVPTDRVSPPILMGRLTDDGKGGDQVAGDNVFSSPVTVDEVGEYYLEIVGRSPTFERRQRIPFRVKPRLVNVTLISGEGLHVKAPPSEGEDGHGKGAEVEAEASTKYFLISLSPEAQKFSGLQVTLAATDSEKRRYKLPLTQKAGEEGGWVATTQLIPHEGSFTITASIEGRDKKQRLVHGISKEVEYLHKPTGEGPGIVEEVEVKSAAPKVVEKRDTEPSSLPMHLLVLLANGAAAGLIISREKKGTGGSSFTVPDLSVPQKVHDALHSLEVRRAKTDIDLNDPALNSDDDGDSSKKDGGKKTPEAAPPQEAESEPESEPSDEEEPPAEAEGSED